MIAKATDTNVLPTSGLLTTPTGRTGLGCVGFILQDNHHASTFALVREQEARLAAYHLMNLLVGLRAIVESLPDVPHIANDYRLDTIAMECRNKSGRLLVLNIADLVIEFAKLFALALDKFPSALRAARFRVYLAGKFCFDLVLVLADRAQLAAIQDRAVLAIVGYGHVDFAQIHARRLVASRFGYLFSRVRRYRFVLLTLPTNNQRARHGERPIQNQGRIAFAVGKNQLAITMPDSRVLVFNTKEPPAAARRICARVGLAPRPPRFERCEKGLHTGVGSVGVEVIGVKPSHHAGRFQPHALMPHRSPKPDNCIRVETPTLKSERVQLRGFADFDSADCITQSTSFLSFTVFLDDFRAHVASGRRKIAARPERWQPQEVGVLLSQIMRSESLALFDDFCRARCRPYAHKKMNVVRIDGKFKYLPSFIFAFRLYKLAAILCDVPRKHRLAALRTPDKVINNQVYSVLVALILHVDKILFINRETNVCFRPGRLFSAAPSPAFGGLKPVANPPNHCH